MKPLGKEHTQLAREYLAEMGIEMTPDELNKEREAAFDMIRHEMKKLGYTMPDNDEDLFLLLHEVYETL